MGEDADVLFTVPCGMSFWASGQFEPLIVAIVFPLTHVPSYTGPWLVKGTDKGACFKWALDDGFKRVVTGELHGMDGIMQCMWKDATRGSRAVLQQLLTWAGRLPPVQKCMVQRVLPRGTKQPFPTAGQERGDKRLQSGS